MICRIFAIAFVVALPVAAQESGKTSDLQFNTADLEFRVTDFAGNPVEIAGTVQDLQVKELGNEVRIDLAALGKAAAIVKERAKGTVMIAGHTDSKGGDAYNMALSERRANSVRDWFRTRGGLASFSFETKGFGAKQPVAPNQKADGSDDPVGRQKNRRVEITIRK